MRTIGIVDSLHRYPVKSMRGEALDSARVTYTGIAGDRVFAFIDPKKDTNFPWFTVRENPKMLLYQPRFLDAPPQDKAYPQVTNFSVEVTTPTGKTGLLSDARFVDELRETLGYAFEVRFSEKGMQDARPISIFGLSTAKKLSEETGLSLDPLRFRANIYAKWDEATPFYEDDLVGKHIKIGDTVELYIQKKDPRCKIISVDPETAASDPNVLLTVAKNHKGCAGVYAVVVREGIVKSGDTIGIL